MNDVKFGMMLLYPLPRPIQKVYGLSKRLEDLGFDSLWLPDHILAMTFPEFTPDTWSILGALSTKTEKIKLATGVTCPHRRHPAVLAQTAATIDHLSNGRFILGIGAGEGYNLDPFGIKWEKPVSKLIESIYVMRKLWKSDSSKKIDFNGEFYTLKDAYLEINPVQETIPIYIGANGPRTRRITGEIADGWIPTLESPETYKIHLEEIKTFAKKSNRNIDDIDRCLLISTAISEEEKDLPGKGENSIVGNVNEAIEKIDEFIKSGVRHFCFWNLGPDQKEVQKVYGEKIIPYFKDK